MPGDFMIYDPEFQSTHSLRSATRRSSHPAHRPEFQSTHSLRSATDFTGFGRADPPVSIHALLAECDGMILRGFMAAKSRFQSTHSLRSATMTLFCPGATVTVSIHALLAECDYSSKHEPRRKSGFNPRTPCGVRPSAMMGSGGSKPFQSTHSLRSATGADNRPEWSADGFNPRTPCGVRPLFFMHDTTITAVSIHALLAECDRLSSPGKN